MLQEAIELQYNSVSRLVERIASKKEITFRAPTGSGKTFMMSDFMERILSTESDVVFLVSTLSKGGLAEQNYDKYLEYSASGRFKHLRPYLINTKVSGEERISIPDDYNVYVLPRDLYKEGGLLMQGAMTDFLQRVTTNIFGSGLNKRIFVIKDECHQATNNLDTLAPSFFSKIINFSATPNLSRGQNPDVEITDEDAVNVKLIKRVEQGDDNETVEDAINKFEEIKKDYRNQLGVNPCLIIQISNKEKADEELNNQLKDFGRGVGFSASGSTGLMLNEQDKEHARNIVQKALSKQFSPEFLNRLDEIITFDQLDMEAIKQIIDIELKELFQRIEQIGYHIDLSEEAKELATTAWVWGIIPESQRRSFVVKLAGKEDTRKQVQIQTTRLKTLTQKKDFNLEAFISSAKPILNHHSIFDLHRKMYGQDAMIGLCYEYATDVEKWWKFTEHFDSIKAQYEQYICDYGESMELVTDDSGKKKTVSFPLESLYAETDKYLQISDWVWKRKEGVKKFSFDSEAEKEWAEILKDISRDAAKELSSTPEDPKLFDDEGHNIPRICLWGKNFPNGSDIKFGYYLNGLHDSYPDFVFVDKKGIIHLFEVKSLNVKKDSNIDAAEYQNKVLALKSCYKQCSILTEHVFYLPVLKDDEWQITRFIKGDEKTLSEDQFRDSFLED